MFGNANLLQIARKATRKGVKKELTEQGFKYELFNNQLFKSIILAIKPSPLKPILLEP
jgi:ABC-type uncharacterized transport system substrate-binding protein